MRLTDYINGVNSVTADGVEILSKEEIDKVVEVRLYGDYPSIRKQKAGLAREGSDVRSDVDYRIRDKGCACF